MGHMVQDAKNPESVGQESVGGCFVLSEAKKGEGAFRVLLIGRHELLMAFLADQLRRDGRFRVVGVVPSSALASHIVRESPVDLIVLDLDIAGAGCLEDLTLIRRNCPSTRLLLMASHLTEEVLQQSRTVQASGLLLKDDLAQTVVSALLDTLAGGESYSAAVASRLVGNGEGRLNMAPEGAPLRPPQPETARQHCSTPADPQTTP